MTLARNGTTLFVPKIREVIFRWLLSITIALSSSLQIALFIAPLLVFLSIPLGHPWVLEFNNFEIIALLSAAVIGAIVAIDGRSNWLEGTMLLAVYLILGIGFFFLPSLI